MRSSKILIVADDPGSRYITRLLLEYRAFEVDEAATVIHAMRFLKTTAYAAAVIDLSLPGMGGWQLCRTMQQRRIATPCIGMVTFHSSCIAREAVDAGFSALVSKPVDVTAFIDNVLRVVKTENS